jgi:hypothetical protein
MANQAFTERRDDATDNVDLVRLRNGMRVSRSVVAEVEETLHGLHKGRPPAFLAAYSKAHNPDHKPLQESIDVLTELGILDADGNMPDATRSVIFAAIESRIDGPRTTVWLVNPYT